MSFPPASLGLCTWNIHLGIELERIVATLRAAEHFRHLDLLLLQEASVHAGCPDAERLATELGPNYRAIQRNVDSLHGRLRGLAFVWNERVFDFKKAELLPLPHLKSSMLARRHRYWLHPLRLRPRSALMVEGVVRGARVRTYVVHLSPVGFAFQTEQLATILRHAAHSEICELLVVAGDFNSLRVDHRRWADWFAAREAEGFVNASQDVNWTFRSRALPVRQKLDNALVRGGAGLPCGAVCPPLAGSDHLPLFFTVAMA